jgi:hypothetical protein
MGIIKETIKLSITKCIFDVVEYIVQRDSWETNANNAGILIS